MKTKKFRGKLKLNKKTIAHLDNGNMKALYGGIRTDGCPSWIKTDCTCGTLCPEETCPIELCPPPTQPIATEEPVPECLTTPFYCILN
jgi:natural product precursor